MVTSKGNLNLAFPAKEFEGIKLMASPDNKENISKQSKFVEATFSLHRGQSEKLDMLVENYHSRTGKHITRDEIIRVLIDGSNLFMIMDQLENR